MTKLPQDARRLSEDATQRLLARATELEAVSPVGLTLEQLREVARETGISLEAFDAAAAELERLEPEVKRKPSWWGRFRARVGAAFQRDGDVGDAAIRNVVAFGAAWALLGLFAAVSRVTGAPWLVHKFTDPLALAMGVALASRIRARTSGVILAGLAIATATEFALDLAYGQPSIQGFASHIALMISGIGGVLLGVWALRRRSAPRIQPT